MAENIKTPKITVLMPVYNGERFIRESIKSVLNQTLRDFELVIINDGSTDKTESIVKSFSDSRILYIKNEKNSGLGAVRNQLLSLAQGEYIAWNDADDISMRDRMEKQSFFLDTYKNFVMVGSWVEIINENSLYTGIRWKDHINEKEMPAYLLFNNRFAQSSVMIRKSLLLENPYRQEFAPAEDYDLWIRLANEGKVWNIPKVLLLYRRHNQNISQTKAKEKDDAVRKIITEQLVKLGINPTETEYKIHRTNFMADYGDMDQFFNLRENWLLKLIDANNKTSVYDKKMFAHVTAKMWLISCQSNIKKYPGAWKRFNDSPLANYLGLSKDWRELLKFRLKSII